MIVVANETKLSLTRSGEGERKEHDEHLTLFEQPREAHPLIVLITQLEVGCDVAD